MGSGEERVTRISRIMNSLNELDNEETLLKYLLDVAAKILGMNVVSLIDLCENSFCLSPNVMLEDQGFTFYILKSPFCETGLGFPLRESRLTEKKGDRDCGYRVIS